MRHPAVTERGKNDGRGGIGEGAVSDSAGTAISYKGWQQERRSVLAQLGGRQLHCGFQGISGLHLYVGLHAGPFPVGL